MPQNVTTYQVLISCPGDIVEEINAIQEAVELFNQQYTSVLNIAIQTRHWSNSSFPQSGGKPQTLLNKQFVFDCDAAIAIMWTRFGTPTDKYGSGTEEEIELMLQNGKQVFMYFSDAPIKPSKYNSDEYKRVQAFREHYKNLGVYSQYSSLDEFKKLIYAHLSQYFLSQRPISEVMNAHTSKLLLRGIDENGHISEKASIHLFCPQNYKSCEDYRARIEFLYKKINSSNVIRSNRLDEYKSISFPTAFTYYEPVKINDNIKTLLQEVATHMDIKLSEDFFELGTLQRSTINTSLFGSEKYKGTNEEKEKYSDIVKLQNNICNLAIWTKVENVLFKLYCIKLCVSNEGTSFDEDIELTIILPKETFVSISQFPTFDEETSDFLCHNDLLKHLICLDSTAYYLDYSSSNRELKPSINQKNRTDRYIYERSIKEHYEEQLSDSFCYSIYEDKNNYLIKTNFDYIKHNTSIALPTPIFVHSPIDAIEYRITSKHCPDAISGKIDVHNHISLS